MEKKIDWEQVSKERRGKVLWLSRQQVFQALVVSSQNATQITRIALPEHYRIREVHYDALRSAFGFFIESPEFPINVIGTELPSVDSRRFREIAIDLPKEEND